MKLGQKCQRGDPLIPIFVLLDPPGTLNLPGGFLFSNTAIPANEKDIYLITGIFSSGMIL